MKLTCVIELLPFAYATQEYKSPLGSAIESPKEWNAYWHNSISDSGLGNLKAVREGSFFVNIEELTTANLVVILQKELEDIELDEYEDQIAKMIGGLVISEGEVCSLEPMCCGDLDSLNEWETIASSEENIWHQLWIGHPWVYYRRESGRVMFSDYIEHTGEAPVDLVSKFTILEAELVSQLESIKITVPVFCEKIEMVLHSLAISNASEIAKLLVGIK
ncbi:hypothetical protein AS361_08040 [Myroides marinus]|uniref:hypothetical protein n=1 Tax=Myroides marinus TaxID=703342 RepID=UPI0007420239|nr:hypothetical protein [Myroides marinus]KUF38188.1 hypothetical protein AS361_08040 [Myroides marinus]